MVSSNDSPKRSSFHETFKLVFKGIPVPALVGLLWTNITGLACFAKPFGDAFDAFTGVARKFSSESEPPVCGVFLLDDEFLLSKRLEVWDHEPLGTFVSQFSISAHCRLHFAIHLRNFPNLPVLAIGYKFPGRPHLQMAMRVRFQKAAHPWALRP